MTHEQRHRARPGASEQAEEAARRATRADAVLQQRRRRATQPGIAIGGAMAQAKLAVGSVDDPLEREADATASRVVRALRLGTPAADETQTDTGTGTGVQRATQPAPLVVDDRADAAGRISRIQRSAVVGAQGGDLDDDTTRLLNSSRGGGAPLPEPARSKMEGAFGADFSGVRVHAGATSTELNNRIQAKAFTTGNDIFFRDQVPDASTGSGQELLAHELTHTIQQTAPIRRDLEKDSPEQAKKNPHGSDEFREKLMSAPKTLSDLAKGSNLSLLVWSKNNDVLLDILLGPFEANWFKAKACLTMDQWPLPAEHPRPSHEAGIKLMQALVVMRKAKWTEFVNTVVKPGFQERMKMFGAVKEPLVDVPKKTREPQQQEKQNPSAALAAAPEWNASNDYDLQSDIDSSEAEKGKKLQEIFDSVGAEAVTSDVDLASGGSNSELGIQFVNERFRSQFVKGRVIPYDPGTVFDINVYASDWLHGDLGVTDSVGKGSAGEDSAGKATKVRTITPAKEVSETTKSDELKRIRKMEVWSLVKVRRNMEDDVKEWDTYKDATLANLTDESARAEMESKLSEANTEYLNFAKKVKDRQAKMLASLTAQEAAFFGGGASAFGAGGDHFAKDASFTRAANAIYEETLQTVKELRLRIERLRAAPAKNDEEISNVGVLLSSKIAEALTYANEVYATEGAVKHTVLKQGAGNKLKKLQAKPETADLTGLDYNLTPELYLQAVNENVGDSLHSIHHFHDMPKYAVYRAGKYLARLIDATQLLLGKPTAGTAPSYDTLLKIGTESVRVKKITNGKVEGDPARIEGDPKFVDDDDFFKKYTGTDLPLIRAQIIQFGAMIPKLFADKQKAQAALAKAENKMPLEQS